MATKTRAEAIAADRLRVWKKMTVGGDVMRSAEVLS